MPFRDGHTRIRMGSPLEGPPCQLCGVDDSLSHCVARRVTPDRACGGVSVLHGLLSTALSSTETPNIVYVLRAVLPRLRRASAV